MKRAFFVTLLNLVAGAALAQQSTFVPESHRKANACQQAIFDLTDAGFQSGKLSAESEAQNSALSAPNANPSEEDVKTYLALQGKARDAFRALQDARENATKKCIADRP